MRTLKLIYKASVIFALVVLASLLSGWAGTRAQIFAFSFLVSALVFWVGWPIFTHRSADEIIHDNQQKALRRFHRMQARDRREQEYKSWWKSLRIGR